MTKREIVSYSLIMIIAAVLYVGVSTILGLHFGGKRKLIFIVPPESTGKEGQILPSISMLLPDSTTTINTANIGPGDPAVLFYFGPYCPYCQLEIKEIVDNIGKLESIRFYLITAYSFGEMKKFYNQYNLAKYRNIVVGIDTRYSFGTYFNTVKVPFVAIYGKDRKLNGAFVGNLSSDQIISVSKE